MPWGVAAAVVGAAGAASAASKQADAADSGIDAQRDMQNMSSAQTRVQRQSGNRSTRQLDNYLGQGSGDIPRAQLRRKILKDKPALKGNKKAIRAEIERQTEARAKRRESDKYGSLLKEFTNEDFVKDPGYQFRMDEGAQAVDRSAAARGGLLSGAAMKAMQKYGQGFASNEFGNAYNRDAMNKERTYNMLSGQQAQGASSTAQNLGIQAGATNQISNLYGNRGDAQAAGTMGMTNAITGGMQSYQGMQGGGSGGGSAGGGTSSGDWWNLGG